MASFLGPLGGMVKMPCVSEIQSVRESRYRVSTSVEGVARARLLPHPLPRSWQASVAVEDPGMLDVVEAYALGLYGPGPFAFVSCDAARLNVLTPAQSALRNVGPGFAPAGPVTVQGTSLPVSAAVSVSSSWRGLVDVPVTAGMPVTASVWVQSATGAPIITTAFFLGSSMTGTSSVAGESGGMWQRLTWSGIAPAGATQLRLGVRSSVTAVAGPQVTWTRGPVPYAMGRGAESVIVESAQSVPIYLPGPYSSGSYTVREVGYAGW